MADKSHERECLDKVIKCKNTSGNYAKQIHSILKLNKDNITENERPDFIVKLEDGAIGIEHCQVDVLFKTKKHSAHSLMREQESRGLRKINDYKQHPDKLDEEIENGQSMEFALGMVEERFDARKEFNYSAFIDNFKDVCYNHNDKCVVYKERIIQNYSQCLLMCLMEIPYPNTLTYLITDKNNHKKEQALKGMPITEDIIHIIQNMDCFDVVIMCLYCYDDPNNSSKSYVLYFDPKAMPECIKQQNIRLYKQFDYPHKENIKLSYIKTEEGFDISASVSNSKE